MAPIKLPEKIARKLGLASDATGETPKALWDRQSKATKLAAFPSLLKEYWDSLTKPERASRDGDWTFWGRPSQQIPAEKFSIWMILAGRGWGKTRTGAQFVIDSARRNPKKRGALVGATVSDVRDVMILGDSGIIESCPADFKPLYEPSKRRLTFPNGAVVICYTADQPNRLRGPNLTFAWCDELAAWRYPQQAWDMLMYCTRKGANPRVCVTTTPRPIPLVKQLVADAKDKTLGVILTRGTTWDNFWNLNKEFFTRIIGRVKGALSRQEVFAEILDAVEGALWTHDGIKRVLPKQLPKMKWCFVGVDPAENDGPDNDEAGIVAVGKDEDENGYVLEDVSIKAHPAIWARRAYELWLRLDADGIVVETNRGGKMVAHTIRSVIRPGEPSPRIIEVVAARGKATRAEPIAAIYEEGRFFHVGNLARLEDEMCSYVPGLSKRSPNRMDALVWAATKLFPPRLVNN